MTSPLALGIGAELSAALEQVVSGHLVECLDDIGTRRILDTFESAAPELVSAVVPGVISVTQMTEILKSLIREGLPVRSFDLILLIHLLRGP